MKKTIEKFTLSEIVGGEIENKVRKSVGKGQIEQVQDISTSDDIANRFDSDHYLDYLNKSDSEVLEEYKSLCEDVIGNFKDFEEFKEAKEAEEGRKNIYTYIGPDQQTMLRIMGLEDIMKRRNIKFEKFEEVERWI